MVGAFTVTPSTADYTAMLTEKCPCSGSWVMGQRRVLTLCPEELCDTTIFGYGTCGTGSIIPPAFYSTLPSERASKGGRGGRGRREGDSFLKGGATPLSHL